MKNFKEIRSTLFYKDIYEKLKFYFIRITENKIIDVETTMRGKNNSPSAHYIYNKLLLVGSLYNNIVTITKKHETDISNISNIKFIGHNIKFDLRWILEEKYLTLKEINNITLHDTGIFEFIFNNKKNISLNECADKYKIGYVKSKFLEQAIEDKKDLENELLNNELEFKKYLEQDLKITQDVYYKQLKLPFLTLNNKTNIAYAIEMEMLKIYLEMEHTGIHFDREKLSQLVRLQSLEQTVELDILNTMIIKITNNYPASLLLSESDISYNSKATINYLLGITEELEVSWPVDKVPYTLLSKRNKVNWKLKLHRNPSSIKIDTPVLEQIKSLLTSYDEKTLEKVKEILNKENYTVLEFMLKGILNLRLINKLINTYLFPILEYLQTSIDGRLHTNYNLTSVPTGRTSSNSPNVQNFPPEIKELISSQNPDGYLLSLDFSQAELCAFAQFTKDPIMIDELNRGVDIIGEINKEFNTLVFIDPSSLSEEEKTSDRRLIKGIIYGTLYGGYAKNLVEQLNVPLEVIELVQSIFKSKYKHGFKVLNDYLNETGKELNKERPLTSSNTYHFKKKVKLENGRILEFNSIESKAGNKGAGLPYISKPQQFDYPCQALAFDFIKLFLVILNNYKYHVDSKGTFSNVRWSNLIHDELVMEIDNWDKDQYLRILEILDLIATQIFPAIYEGLYEEKFLVPIKYKLKSKGKENVNN